MNLLVIAGTQLRHRYFLSLIDKYFKIKGIVYYKRKLIQETTNHKKTIDPIDIELEKKHFKNLSNKEKEYFSKAVKSFNDSSIPQLIVSGQNQLNHYKTIDWVKSKNADVIIDYGSGILSKKFLDICPEWTINLHGGLSPYYKGSATLFWPFYFQQPELAGITYHMIDSKIDHGSIIQHFRPIIKLSDTLHDIGCRAIKDGTLIGIKLLKKLQQKGSLDLYPQNITGKLFLEKDYRPSHIKTVYDLWENGLIKKYLKNKKYYDDKYHFIDQIGNHDYGVD